MEHGDKMDMILKQMLNTMAESYTKNLRISYNLKPDMSFRLVPDIKWVAHKSSFQCWMCNYAGHKELGTNKLTGHTNRHNFGLPVIRRERRCRNPQPHSVQCYNFAH